MTNSAFDLLAPLNVVTVTNGSIGTIAVTQPHGFQAAALSLSQPFLREAHSPLKRFGKTLQNPLQRHSSYGTPPYQQTRPTSRAAANTPQVRRSTLLARTEDQLPHRIQTYPVYSSSAPTGFVRSRNPLEAGPALAQRQNGLGNGGQTAADDIAML